MASRLRKAPSANSKSKSPPPAPRRSSRRTTTPASQPPTTRAASRAASQATSRADSIARSRAGSVRTEASDVVVPAGRKSRSRPQAKRGTATPAAGVQKPAQKSSRKGSNKTAPSKKSDGDIVLPDIVEEEEEEEPPKGEEQEQSREYHMFPSSKSASRGQAEIAVLDSEDDDDIYAPPTPKKRKANEQPPSSSSGNGHSTKKQKLGGERKPTSGSDSESVLSELDSAMFSEREGKEVVEEDEAEAEAGEEEQGRTAGRSVQYSQPTTSLQNQKFYEKWVGRQTFPHMEQYIEQRKREILALKRREYDEPEEEQLENATEKASRDRALMPPPPRPAAPKLAKKPVSYGKKTAPSKAPSSKSTKTSSVASSSKTATTSATAATTATGTDRRQRSARSRQPSVRALEAAASGALLGRGTSKRRAEDAAEGSSKGKKRARMEQAAQTAEVVSRHTRVATIEERAESLAESQVEDEEEEEEEEDAVAPAADVHTEAVAESESSASAPEAEVPQVPLYDQPRKTRSAANRSRTTATAAAVASSSRAPAAVEEEVEAGPSTAKPTSRSKSTTARNTQAPPKKRKSRFLFGPKKKTTDRPRPRPRGPSPERPDASGPDKLHLQLRDWALGDRTPVPTWIQGNVEEGIIRAVRNQGGEIGHLFGLFVEAVRDNAPEVWKSRFMAPVWEYLEHEVGLSRDMIRRHYDQLDGDEAEEEEVVDEEQEGEIPVAEAEELGQENGEVVIGDDDDEDVDDEPALKNKGKERAVEVSEDDEFDKTEDMDLSALYAAGEKYYKDYIENYQFEDSDQGEDVEDVADEEEQSPKGKGKERAQDGDNDEEEHGQENGGVDTEDESSDDGSDITEIVANDSFALSHARLEESKKEREAPAEGK